MTHPSFRARRILVRVVALTFVLGSTLLVAELLFRGLGGFRIFSWRLEADQAPTDHRGTNSAEALQALIADFAGPAQRRSDLEFGWFFAPASPPTKSAPDQDSVLRVRNFGFDWVNYVFNSRYLASESAKPDGMRRLFHGLDLPWITVADPPSDGSERPAYRYPSGTTLPSGLTLNRFGFRGRDLPLVKPPRTVRIACVGASTTVGSHHYAESYPELLERWLALWGKKAGLGVAFEVINAGREGIQPADSAGIVRHELLPFEPDYLLYYEGANVFRPETAVKWEGDHAYGVPPPGAPRTLSRDGLLSRLAQHSAIASRIHGTLSRAAGQPYSRPAQRWVLDPSLDQADTPLSAYSEVLGLERVWPSLDQIRGDCESTGIRLVLCSFASVATVDLDLSAPPYAGIEAYFSTLHWPLSYENLARAFAVQNRAFAAFARTHALEFVDVAARIPRHPELYIDGIHHTESGIRALAWSVFEPLTLVLQKDLGAGRVPRAATGTASEHPYLSRPSTRRVLKRS